MGRTEKYPACWAAIGVATLLNALVITGAAIGLYNLRESFIREAEIRSQNFALAIDLAVSTEIAKVDLLLKTAVAGIKASADGLPISGSDTVQEIATLMQGQKELLSEIDGWEVVDANGNVLVRDDSFDATSPSVEEDAYFQKLRSNGKDELFVSGSVVDRPAGGAAVLFSRPLIDEHHVFRGGVSIALPVAYLNTLLSGFNIGINGAVTLRDRDLDLITGLAWREGGEVAEIRNAAVSARYAATVAAEKKQDTFRDVVSNDDPARVVSVRKLSNAPLYGAVGLPMNGVLADWQRIAVSVGGLLALFLVTMNVLALLLFRLFRRQQRDAALLRQTSERFEASLRTLEQQDRSLHAAQETGKLGTYALRIADEIWSGSEMLHTILGVGPDVPHTRETWFRLVHPEDVAMLKAYFQHEVLGKHRNFDAEYRIVRPDTGELRWLHGLGKLELDGAGHPALLTGIIHDISERRFSEERLHLADEVFQNATEGIVVTDRDGCILEVNPAVTQITGYTNEEVRGKNVLLARPKEYDEAIYTQLWETLHATGRWEGELLSRRKDGHHYVQYTRISAIHDARGVATRFCFVFSDISVLKESQRRLEFMAYHDGLTGLANRQLLSDRLLAAMQACRSGTPAPGLVAVCYLDIDGFKRINDRWGHGGGNQLLVEVANRLKSCAREGDTVARLGGDEFVLVLTATHSVSEVSDRMYDYLQAISRPVAFAGTKLNLTACVGITTYPDDPADDPDVLLRHADQAMFEAKRSGGRNCMRFFDRAGDQQLMVNKKTREHLVQALMRNELCLFYQPKVALQTGGVVGLEALVRWNHPEEGLLSPGRFLPAIEASEMTLAFDEWVLHEVMEQRHRWQGKGLEMAVGVNIFTRHLQRADFVSRLERILAVYPNLDPQGLELEILETTILEDLPVIADRLSACRRLGVRSSLDDFGTGFSSLTYLRQLPTETVKIDRSFVMEILTNVEDQSLVQGIVGMAQSLHRLVVAEGVETLEHGVLLLRCGCHMAQGYGIARPMPGDAVAEWVRNWRAPEVWRDEVAALARGTRFAGEHGAGR